MNLPGFTAEASLYQAPKPYRARIAPSGDGRREIVPEAMVTDPQCVNRCIMAGGSRRECSQVCRQPAPV